MRFMCERVEPRARRLPNDMMPYFDLPPASPPRDRIITPDEWDRYYDFALNQNYNGQGVRWSNRRHRIQTFILLAGETAQRKTAITTLSYDQVHWDHGKYGMINFLPAGATQTNKRRPWVPMTQLLRSVLEQAYEQRVNDLVLDKVTDVKSGLDRVNQQLGIEGVTPHTFRTLGPRIRSWPAKTSRKLRSLWATQKRLCAKTTNIWPQITLQILCETAPHLRLFPQIAV